MHEKPNIVLIIIDALRARNLGCYGYPKPTSPNIDKLAEEGILFENAFSCAVVTCPSIVSILSGDYPLSHQILKMEPTTTTSLKNIKILNENGTLFLPEILKSEGYTTLAVDWLGGWLKRGYDYYSGIPAPKRLKLFRFLRQLKFRSARMKYMRKVKNFLEQQNTYNSLITKFSTTVQKLPASYGGPTTDTAINLLKKVHNKKFFLLLHYWDTHAPYNPPKEYFEKFIEYDYGNYQSVEELLSQLNQKNYWLMRTRILRAIKTVKEVLVSYDSSIAFVDHEIGRLTKTLQDLGILEETLIILTSDHGESLTEHQIYFCHHGLYDVTTHVPLIFSYHGFPKNRRVKGLIQHTDIAPTLLDLLGIKDRGLALDGKSFVPLIHKELDKLRDAVLIEEANAERKRAIRTEKHKYITALSREDAVCKECDFVHGGIEEFYNLNKDPEETHNALDESPREAKILKEELSKWVELLEFKRKKRGIGKTEKADLYYSAEEEKLIAKRLRELGYV